MNEYSFNAQLGILEWLLFSLA